VAHHDGSVDGAGRRRGPAARDPIVEELVGGRAVVPHGDRGDAPESRGVEDDEHVTRAAHDIVRVLVLDDHVEDLEAAVQNVLEGVEAGHVSERRNEISGDSTDDTQLPRHPIRMPDLRYDTGVRRAGLFVISLVVMGCIRDPAEALCPEAAEGDLVVTEISGPQMGNELLREYVEIYNASGAPLDLYGVKVRFRRFDGSNEIAILVRRSVVAAPGSYTVLGRDNDLDLESYIDYGFAVDYSESWLGAAAVDVEACGTRIDRATYDSLPRVGTYSLGTTPPTAEDNDLPANWCIDTRTTPGSPQQANVACP